MILYLNIKVLIDHCLSLFLASNLLDYFCVMRVLILSNVWVEPTSSAAGRRMLQLLTFFRAQQWEVTYGTTAKKSVNAYNLAALGIDSKTIAINDDGFNAFAKALNPQLVLFDRFMLEEQFGWRVMQECPDAIRMLDTEDLHCLRKARQQAVKEGRGFKESDLLSDVAKREIASIYRCDMTLMISQFEIDLLHRVFRVPAIILTYLPFLEEPLDKSFQLFEERKDFVSIGNFLHPPNWDATLELKNNIWPYIKKQLPEAQLYIYGAYPSEKAKQLHNEQAGFIISGRAENAKYVISKARVLLAPLRFGAGLKGKFIDAMQCGTPSVTTTIGVEGMRGDLAWGGEVIPFNQNEYDKDAFAKAAVQLYTHKSLWEEAKNKGIEIINSRFQSTHFTKGLEQVIENLIDNLTKHREANFTGQMLQHHSLQSSKYMSKWIEEKNKRD